MEPALQAGVKLHWIDWAIVGAYLLFCFWVGIRYSKKAESSPEDFFLAGRSLPWWMLGTSMVATTFAADTPLAITEMVRQDGIWKNWFWWNWLLYGLLGVFLFSRLWRRANVLTENELIELRYSGKPAAFLRIFKASYFATLFNFIVMGWVISSMASILTVMLGGNEKSYYISIAILCVITLVYTLTSGLWGVVVTDVVQFVIAMFGAVALAIFAVAHVGGLGEMVSKASAAAANSKHLHTLDFIPRMPSESLSLANYVQTPFFQFLVLVFVMSWSNHSTDGGGYITQRMMAAKDERHAFAGTLWYNFANYALRSWPWIVVALVSLHMFPTLANQPENIQKIGDKAAYTLVLNEVLGTGFRGILLVSFLAAFMSTIDTHLNWSASYLVNDIYRRFIKRDSAFASKEQANRHYVRVSQIATVLMMVCGAIVATQIGRVDKAWNFVWAMGSGIGLVLILRWFWWRVNAWSEITALAVSVLGTIYFELIAFRQTVSAGLGYSLFGRAPVLWGIEFKFELQLVFIVFASVISWLTVTFLTKPEPQETLLAFYRKVQPGGFWGPIRPLVTATLPPVARSIVPNFLAGLALVWGFMFFIGNALFGYWAWASVTLLMSILGGWWIWHSCLRKQMNGDDQDRG